MISPELVSAARMLRQLDYQAWEIFLTALRSHAATQAANMLTCDASMLPRAQGMAIAANEIYTSLRDAHVDKREQVHAPRNPGNSAFTA